jgi:hypothetical protein
MTWDNVLSLAKSLGKSARTKAQLIEIAYAVKAACGVRDAVLSETIGQVVKEYDDRLNNLVYRTWNTLEHAGYEQTALVAGLTEVLRNNHKALIRELGPQAYYEGMREAGVKTPEDDADETDQVAIREWIAGQVARVNDFAIAVLAAGTDKAKRAQIVQRMTFWVDNVRTVGGMGYMNSKRNMPGTWKMNFVHPTKEHCTTCAMLNGKRRRLKWFLSNGYIPRQRGSITLSCRGYNCGCAIVTDEGVMIL